MLHIVQVIMSGSAEVPQLFVKKERAEAAYVEAVKKYWRQSYAAYCEQNGVAGDSYASAQAFVASFDLADRSRIHHWILDPEDAETGSDSTALEAQREQARQLIAGMEQASDIFKSGLSELRALSEGRGDAEAGTTGQPAEGSQSFQPGAAAMPFSDPFPSTYPGMLPSATPVENPAPPMPDSEQYNTKEWKDYVNSIMQMCGGNRAEYHLFKRADWRQAVYHDETKFEYWDWVAFQIDEHIEKAQKADYSVIEDPEQPGNFRFQTPTGEASDITTETEGEAWCRAGLHLEGRR